MDIFKEIKVLPKEKRREVPENLLLHSEVISAARTETGEIVDVEDVLKESGAGNFFLSKK